MVSLLAGSMKAVAHVDVPPSAGASVALHASVPPAPDDGHGAQKHCDLCGHGLCHLAAGEASTDGRIAPIFVRALGPEAPPPTARTDRQDRPPR